MRGGAVKQSLRRLGLFALAFAAVSCDRVSAAFPPPWNDPVASSRTLTIGGASIQVDFGPGDIDLAPEQVITWVRNAAQSVSVYYGKFPVARDRILVEFDAGGRGVRHGTTWGGVGGFPAFTRIHVGEHTTQQDLDSDWMMTHELIHTGFPSMEDDHHWIEEGLAVYVEPISRAQNGLLRPEKIWSDMVRDMPQGDPRPGDRGLDRTHTWGRTYWGGAQFCLKADVAIRKETHNQRGLEDALRGIVAAGGTIDHDWAIEKAFAAGDQATGTHVLSDLYNQVKDKPVPGDLDELWKDLGVERTADGVSFRDGAPDAEIRRAITRPEK
ncbi:MAG: hypothetical protein JOZ83_09805 [Silvibacterium sp.]|nr:hypothetical protein [Silvibacterium sp.]